MADTRTCEVVPTLYGNRPAKNMKLLLKQFFFFFLLKCETKFSFRFHFHNDQQGATGDRSMKFYLKAECV